MMNDISEKGGYPIKMDVTSQEDIDRAVSEVLKKESSIDILINNAGYGFYGSLEESTMEQAKQLFDVNVFGLAQMSKAVLPTMRSQKSGIIINISSVVGKVAFPFLAWYSSSKYAVEGLSDALRVELKPFGIKVVLIEPGRVESEFGKVALERCKESSESPYASQINNLMTTMENMPLGSAKASSISNTVLKILNTSRPKFRYVPNFDGKFAIWGKHWLGDGIIDFVTGLKINNIK